MRQPSPLHLASSLVMALLLSLVICEVGQAHGIRRVHYDQFSVVVEAVFSGGSPASYADVHVFAPDDPDTEFQNGRTDKHGRFAFLPDSPGMWRVKVDAGMGHAFTLDITVEPDWPGLP